MNCKHDNQPKAVQEILYFIAKDSRISVVTRLIDFFKKVTSRNLKNNEGTNRYFSRFCELAAEHLLKVESTRQSQIGKVQAITPLNNASLLNASLTSIELHFIGMAEKQDKGTMSHEKTTYLTNIRGT